MKPVINTVTELTTAEANEAIVRNAYSPCGLKFAQIPTSQLEIDHSYQRPPKATLMKIAKDWDINKVRAVEVSYRDGKFYVIDGQHRVMAATIVGEKYLPCQIHTGLTVEQEAKLFYQQDINKVKINPVDRFKARLVAGDRSAIELNDVIQRRGLHLTKQKGKPYISALWEFELIHKQYGIEAILWLTKLIEQAEWKSYSWAYTSRFLRLFEKLWVDYRNGNQLVQNNLVHILREDRDEILNAADGASLHNPSAIAAGMYHYINKKMREMNA